MPPSAFPASACCGMAAASIGRPHRRNVVVQEMPYVQGRALLAHITPPFDFAEIAEETTRKIINSSREHWNQQVQVRPRLSSNLYMPMWLNTANCLGWKKCQDTTIKWWRRRGLSYLAQ